jgi:hypothetical protein
MPSSLVVTHERLGTWSRHLRPRLAAPGMGVGTIRWVESRSGTDLERAVATSATPIVLIDLADRPRAMLEDLDQAAQAAPGGLFLVLDPASHPGVPELALELGATLVLNGFVPPPRVAELLLRWLPIAARRAEADGWVATAETEPELWERDDLLGPAPARFGATTANDRPHA